MIWIDGDQMQGKKHFTLRFFCLKSCLKTCSRLALLIFRDDRQRAWARQRNHRAIQDATAKSTFCSRRGQMSKDKEKKKTIGYVI